MSIDTDQSDKIMKMTPLHRSLLDLQNMIKEPPHDAFLRSREIIQAMHEEQKRLSKITQIAYLVTGLLAFLILTGSQSSEAKVSAFGVDVPINLFSQQVLSIFLAGVFGYYITQFAAFIVLSFTIANILSMERADSWQFLAAPYDASTLWSTLVAPKLVGYQSPKRVRIIGIMIMIVSFGTVSTHTIVVFLATYRTTLEAWQSGKWIPFALSVSAMLIVTSSVACLLAAVLWKVPYRLATQEPTVDRQTVS